MRGYLITVLITVIKCVVQLKTHCSVSSLRNDVTRHIKASQRVALSRARTHTQARALARTHREEYFLKISEECMLSLQTRCNFIRHLSISVNCLDGLHE